MANPLDPAGLYQRYKAAQVGRGLGDLFQEEGPGLGPSSQLSEIISTLRESGRGQIKSGMDPRIVNPQTQRRISEETQSESLRRIKDLAPKGLDAAFAEIQRMQKGPKFAGPEDNLSNLVKSQLRAKEADRINVSGPDSPMTLGVGANELSPLDQIAEQLRSVDGVKPAPPPEIKSPDDIIAAQQQEKQARVDSAIDAKMGKDAIAGLLGDSGSPDKNKAVEDTFMGGMSEYYKALAQDVPEVGDRKELLQKYMQEFSEATGIPIGDKIDKSQALMALGLGLMQNRAGKGFNVGRMLSSVGEAGTSAMPYLTKAKDEAKQARIAAGKYALEKIKSDEDARDAIVASNAALKRELAIKDIEFNQERDLAIQEALLEGNDAKVAEALKNTTQKTIKVGAKEVNIGFGRDVESGGKTVFSTPEPDADIVANAYKKTGQGLDTLRRMEDILIRIQDSGEGQLGGPALQTAIEGVISVGNSMGMGLEYPSGDEVALKQQLEIMQRSVMVRFKKFLAQETGNGISNVDVADIKAALGDYNYFEDPAKAIMAVREMQTLFQDSQSELDGIVDMFMDRRKYSDNEQGDAAYEEVLGIFSSKFGDIGIIQPVFSEGEDGQKIIDYDIRSR